MMPNEDGGLLPTGNAIISLDLGVKWEMRWNNNNNTRHSSPTTIGVVIEFMGQ